jgi:pimeloyl-ACP methyl ester carboxylesterase
MPITHDNIAIDAGGGVTLEGDLHLADETAGVVLFAHGSGSSRHSPRNRSVAKHLREHGLGTLLFDLLTAEEEAADRYSGQYRFDVALLARRLEAAIDWLAAYRAARAAVGLFGASTGAAAALLAAAAKPDDVGAVVSRGGRPDLAGPALARVRAPTLLIVGGHDPVVLDLNERALGALHCTKELIVVPGATHLFEEPGTLDAVARHAAEWFARHLRHGERQR